MRIVIIGGSHAGIAAARQLKKIQPAAEVLIIERSNTLGYIGSSLNLYLEGLISDLAEAGTVTPSQLRAEQIHLLMNTQAVKINRKEKTIDFIIQADQKEVPDSVCYDYLILATGSSQYQTDFSVQTQKKITSFKSLTQSETALETLRQAQTIVVIGAGLIGFEFVESLASCNKKIYLIDKMDTVLFRYFDREITDPLMQKLSENLQLVLNSQVAELQLDSDENISGVVLASGEVIQCDAVIYAINPRPNIDLAAADLKINRDGTVACDEQLRTSDPFIYAVGDLVPVYFGATAVPIYLPLVTNAYRTGMIAAANILRQEKISLPQVQRTIVTELFGSYLASTGVNEAEAPYYGLEVGSVTKSYQKESLFDRSSSFELILKLIFAKESKKILGGQLMTTSRPQIEMINTLSALITLGADLKQLSTMDFYFNPKLSLPLHFLNDLALEGILQT